jgi:hypothetical protein
VLVFLDESFREHKKTRRPFGVLAGVAIPEDAFHTFQHDFFTVRRPYHGTVLKEDDEIKGGELLNRATLKRIQLRGNSAHWSLAEDLLGFARSRRIKVFGVVCFRYGLKTFVCGDETKLDVTYRYLFERIDTYMKREFPRRVAKLVFDNRSHQTNEKNARAITNFFLRSKIGPGFDNILRVPFFAVSQGHNYGLQLADLVTTTIAVCFQGWYQYKPLWRIVQQMLYRVNIGGQDQTSLKVMRDQPRAAWPSA